MAPKNSSSRNLSNIATYIIRDTNYLAIASDAETNPRYNCFAGFLTEFYL